MKTIYNFIPSMKVSLLLFILFVASILLSSCSSNKGEVVNTTKEDTTVVMVKPIQYSEVFHKQVTLSNQLWEISTDDYKLLNERDTIFIQHYNHGKPLNKQLCIIQRMYDTKPFASN